MKNTAVNRIISAKAWRKAVSLLLALSVFICSGAFYGLNAGADELEASQTAPQDEYVGEAADPSAEEPAVTASPEADEAAEPEVSDAPGTVEPEVSESPESAETVVPELPAADDTVHEHLWADYWTSDEFSHWQSCVECGAFTALEHIWNEGDIIVSPTDLSGGVIAYTCVVCGAVRTAEIYFGATYCGYKYEHVHTEFCYGWVPAPQPSVDEFVWGLACGYNVEHLHAAECYVRTEIDAADAVVFGDEPIAADNSALENRAWNLYQNPNTIFVYVNGEYTIWGAPYTFNTGDVIQLAAYIPGARYDGNGRVGGYFFDNADVLSYATVDGAESNYPTNSWGKLTLSDGNEIEILTISLLAKGSGNARIGLDGTSASGELEYGWLDVEILEPEYDPNKIYRIFPDGTIEDVTNSTIELHIDDTLTVAAIYNNSAITAKKSDGGAYQEIITGISEYDEGNLHARVWRADQVGDCIIVLVEGGVWEAEIARVNVKVTAYAFEYGKIYVDRNGDGNYEYIETSSENPLTFEVGETLRFVSNPRAKGTFSNNVIYGTDSDPYVFIPGAENEDNGYTYRYFSAAHAGETEFGTGADTLCVKVNYEQDKIYVDQEDGNGYRIIDGGSITVTLGDTIKVLTRNSQVTGENNGILSGVALAAAAEESFYLFTASQIGTTVLRTTGGDMLTVNVVDKYAAGSMFVDVVFGNSYYPDVEISDATAMILGGLNMSLQVHQGAEKFIGDLNTVRNNQNSRFIMYVGETTTVRLHTPQVNNKYFYTSDISDVDTGYGAGINANEYIVLGDTSSDVNGYVSCTVTAVKPGYAEIHSNYSDEVFYIEVKYPIYVETALGEKHMNYINEYVYTANDWWHANGIRDNSPEPSDQSIFSPEGLPIFIKNYAGYLFGFYRLVEDQSVDLTAYTEIGNNTRFVLTSGPSTTYLITRPDEIVEIDGRQYRKVTVTLQTGGINADERGTVTFGDQVFNFMVYNIESDTGTGTGNHFDIEKSDGGKYIITIDNGDGTYTKYTYDVFVTDINGCNVYNKNGDLIAELAAGEYYERGKPEDSSQFELTSAYETDGNGNLLNGVANAKQRAWIRVVDIGEVIFDLQLELRNPSVEVIDGNGRVISNGTPQIIEDLWNLDYLASVSVNMKEHEIIDAYNKCPNHYGLDFTLKKEIFATKQEAEVNKKLTGGTLTEKQFTFKVYRNNPNVDIVVDRILDEDGNEIQVVYGKPKPTAYGYNDAEGKLHFYAIDDVVDDNGNVTDTVERDIKMLSFTRAGTYRYFIKEDIKTDDGIIYDTRMIQIVVKIENVVRGDENTPLKVESINYYWAAGDTTSTNEYDKDGYGNSIWHLFTDNNPAGFTNSMPIELPVTGGSGAKQYAFFGATLIITAFLLLRLKRHSASARR